MRLRHLLPLVLAALATGCGETAAPKGAAAPRPASTESGHSPRHADPAHRTSGRVNVYAHDRRGMLAPAARRARARIYVPNSKSASVDVIDPRSGRRVDHFAVPVQPEHVVPSWDLKTLWVASDAGNALVAINPFTGRHARPIPVDDPYNLYFTPDGSRAIVVAERLQRLDFRAPHSMRLLHSLPVECKGVDHLDFTVGGGRLIASCEFSGQMVEVDVRRERVVRHIPLRPGAMPQDVRLSPDGSTFFVADMASNGVWTIDAHTMRKSGFIATGMGAHGIYPSRSGTLLYVTNRMEGSISVVDPRRRRVLRKWRLPGGGSPDMGGVSADGRDLWVTGRYNGVLYDISTVTGRLKRRIPVGSGPHGAAVWPQPGRYSLGHTGNMR